MSSVPHPGGQPVRAAGTGQGGQVRGAEADRAAAGDGEGGGHGHIQQAPAADRAEAGGEGEREGRGAGTGRAAGQAGGDGGHGAGDEAHGGPEGGGGEAGVDAEEEAVGGVPTRREASCSSGKRTSARAEEQLEAEKQAHRPLRRVLERIKREHEEADAKRKEAEAEADRHKRKRGELLDALRVLSTTVERKQDEIQRAEDEQDRHEQEVERLEHKSDRSRRRRSQHCPTTRRRRRSTSRPEAENRDLIKAGALLQTDENAAKRAIADVQGDMADVDRRRAERAGPTEQQGRHAVPPYRSEQRQAEAGVRGGAGGQAQTAAVPHEAQHRPDLHPRPGAAPPDERPQQTRRTC